jgi:hypothetical protein
MDLFLATQTHVFYLHGWNWHLFLHHLKLHQHQDHMEDVDTTVNHSFSMLLIIRVIGWLYSNKIIIWIYKHKWELNPQLNDTISYTRAFIHSITKELRGKNSKWNENNKWAHKFFSIYIYYFPHPTYCRTEIRNYVVRHEEVAFGRWCPLCEVSVEGFTGAQLQPKIFSYIESGSFFSMLISY